MVGNIPTEIPLYKNCGRTNKMDSGTRDDSTGRIPTILIRIYPKNVIEENVRMSIDPTLKNTRIKPKLGGVMNIKEKQ